MRLNMSVITTVVEAREGCLDAVREYLAGFAEIDIYGENAAVSRILVTIDADDKRIEEICRELTEFEGVLDVLNHSIFFEDAFNT